MANLIFGVRKQPVDTRLVYVRSVDVVAKNGFSGQHIDIEIDEIRPDFRLKQVRPTDSESEDEIAEEKTARVFPLSIRNGRRISENPDGYLELVSRQ